MRLSKILVLLGLLLVFASSAFADTTSEPARPLPATIGKFRRVSTAALSLPRNASSASEPGAYKEALASELAEYVDGKGDRVSVEIVRLRHDAKAYQMLSIYLAQVRLTKPEAEISQDLGTAGFATDEEVSFFKGRHFVRIKNVNESRASLNELALSLSEMLNRGEGDLPVLIQHLPAPEVTQKTAVYLNSFADLRLLPFEHPVLTAVQSGGNADAALATYGHSKILIVEFNTPQLATENDQRISARIQELWKLGQPAPTAYRRVGNYSVFVFDAPDEQTANRLIDDVKYEQVVQWLGENPNIFKEAERRYLNTTLGVLVAVLKASGFALITCFGLGALVGGLLFTYRRAQQKAMTFSDAGGMLRLNLDELTPQTDPARLLRERN